MKLPLNWFSAFFLIFQFVAVGSVFASGFATEAGYLDLRRAVSEEYRNVVPLEWGESVPGVKTRLATREKVIALTFDACGGPRGNGVDRVLLEFLEREQVPATLFINGRWLEQNRAELERLAANPLLQIENHGLRHRPASVSGRMVYGIAGARSAEELIDEIELNARALESVAGIKPRLYRSGTAYYDNVAVKIAGRLGYEIAGFSVLGDAGATFSADKVRTALLAALPGDIVLLHMNHPGSGTAAGVMAAVPELKKRGFRFVRLSDYPLR